MYSPACSHAIPRLLIDDTTPLDPSYTYEDGQLIQLKPAQPDVSQGSPTHGGVCLVLSGLFASSAHLGFTGAVGYVFSSVSANIEDFINGCPFVA